MEPVRISKLLSERGLCSRREADHFIEQGLVLVDGVRVTQLGTKVLPSQTITLDTPAKQQLAEQVTFLYHKPMGIVSGQAEPGYQNAATLITPESQMIGDRSGIQFVWEHLDGLAPAGRLDIDSTGLLVLTQNGTIAKQLIGNETKIEKEYLVRVSGELTERGLALLNHGLHLDGRALRPAQVSRLNEDQLRFILREGRKRQIRRMCELVGLQVTGLKRVRIGRVMLGHLPVGEWRYLAPGESF
jgi:23S rRNA pseudouridine2604 synthase